MKLKSKLTGRLCVVGLVSVILTAMCSMLAFWMVFTNLAEDDLKNYAELVSGVYQQTDDIEALSKMLPVDYRLTLIDQNGEVKYESEAVDIKSLDNHRERPEVKAAIESGVGVSSRESQTLNRVIYYYALKLPDGDILRVAKEVESFYSIFQSITIVIVIIVIFLIVVCFFLSSEMTKGIVKPIERMLENKGGVPYEELSPIAVKLSEQSEQIKQQIEEIQRETDKINTIIANMAEGFILLDTGKNILMKNDSAVHLLHTGNSEILGKSIMHLTRNEKVIKCIDSAIIGKSKSVEFEVKGTQLQLLANPVYSADKQIGVICIIVDISDNKQLDKLKQEFTANVSHELKTPLTSISGYAEMIESGIAKDSDIKTFAHKIHKEAGRLVTLIGDIIKLSQLEEEAPQARPFISVNLKEIAEECVDSLEISAQNHNVIIRTDLTDTIIKGDRSMIYELIYNLCDNAIRYNKENGEVLITAGKKDGKPYVSVKDTGIGIPKHHQARIFERFYRVDKSRSKQTGGTGLGLAIVKHIAEQHKAKISITSEENNGTEITVIFSKSK